MSLRSRFSFPADLTDQASVVQNMAHRTGDEIEEDNNAEKISSTSRRVWDSRWQFLPLIAAFVWLATLIVLLVHWAASNSPIYPSQNGILPFISDIGAQTLKPVFVLGCILSGLSFLGTLFILHLHRQLPYLSPSSIPPPSPSMMTTVAPPPPPSVALTLASTLSLLATTLGILSLILLSYFDTLRHPKLHSALLLTLGIPLFLGCAAHLSLLSIQASHHPHPHRTSWLPRALNIKAAAASLLLLVSVAFAIRMATAERPRGWEFDQAAVLEWVMGVAAAGYMATFWYDLRNVLRDAGATAGGGVPVKREAEV